VRLLPTRSETYTTLSALLVTLKCVSHREQRRIRCHLRHAMHDYITLYANTRHASFLSGIYLTFRKRKDPSVTMRPHVLSVFTFGASCRHLIDKTHSVVLLFPPLYPVDGSPMLSNTGELRKRSITFYGVNRVPCTAICSLILYACKLGRAA